MRTLKHKVAAATLCGAAAMSLLAAGFPANAATSAPTENVTAQGNCGDTYNPEVPGGKAGWTILCGNNRVVVDGWVQDTRPDGRCAEVYGNFRGHSTFYSKKACGTGTVEEFRWIKRDATGANFYLRVR